MKTFPDSVNLILGDRKGFKVVKQAWERVNAMGKERKVEKLIASKLFLISRSKNKKDSSSRTTLSEYVYFP